jgi:hypothetical protein
LTIWRTTISYRIRDTRRTTKRRPLSGIDGGAGVLVHRAQMSAR